jgi:ElaB/YqjD/DUF883 family membrane-anchored ribosome-binding protein
MNESTNNSTNDTNHEDPIEKVVATAKDYRDKAVSYVKENPEQVKQNLASAAVGAMIAFLLS